MAISWGMKDEKLTGPFWRCFHLRGHLEADLSWEMVVSG